MPQFRKASEYKLDGEGGGAPPPSGHNTQAEKDREVLFYVYLNKRRELDAAKKTATKALADHDKLAKKEVGDNAILSFKAFERARTAEGQAEIRAEMEATAEALRYQGVPHGYQFDLLTDRTPLVERAAAEGRRAGLLGETLSNPYNEGSAEGQAYAANWHDGQEELFAGITAFNERKAEADLIKADGGDEGGDLDDGEGGE